AEKAARRDANYPTRTAVDQNCTPDHARITPELPFPKRVAEHRQRPCGLAAVRNAVFIFGKKTSEGRLYAEHAPIVGCDEAGSDVIHFNRSGASRNAETNESSPGGRQDVREDLLARPQL